MTCQGEPICTPEFQCEPCVVEWLKEEGQWEDALEQMIWGKYRDTLAEKVGAKTTTAPTVAPNQALIDKLKAKQKTLPAFAPEPEPIYGRWAKHQGNWAIRFEGEGKPGDTIKVKKANGDINTVKLGAKLATNIYKKA